MSHVSLGLGKTINYNSAAWFALFLFHKGYKVPWKNPQNWLSAELLAPLLSFGLALLRTMYTDDEPSWAKRVIESAMCGLITLSAGALFDAMEMSGDWKFVAAGAIGFLGVDYLKMLMKKIINKKLKDGS